MAGYADAASHLRHLGANIRLRRTRLGLSLREVADAAGVSFSTVYRVERGETFTSSAGIALLTWIDQASDPQPCHRLPDGWVCELSDGHDGPCVATKEGAA